MKKDCYMRKIYLFFLVCVVVMCVSCNQNAGIKYDGSAGGIVFYDKGEYSDGWRYLEAAPFDLRVVNGKPTVDLMADVDGWINAQFCYIFGFYRDSMDGESKLVGTNTSIGSGKENTEKLVDAMGDAAYTFYKSGNKYSYWDYMGMGTTANYAARLCSELVYGGCDDWFLPSRDELNLMYEELYKNGFGDLSGSYWSSSESNADHAWVQHFDNGSQDVKWDREFGFFVRPIRAF